VAGDGGNGLSSEPDLWRLGAVQHFFGVRIHEFGVEDASRGEGQLPHGLVIGCMRHLVEI